MKTLLIFVLIITYNFRIYSHENTPIVDIKNSKLKKHSILKTDTNSYKNFYSTYSDVGIGIGLDYGGLCGVKYTFIPTKYTPIFFSLGYILFDVGFNFGVQLNILPYNSKHNIRPHLKLMYGRNRGIEVKGANHFNKLFLGYTFGGGLEFRFGKHKDVGFNIDICIPHQSEKFKNYYNEITKIKQIEIIRPLTKYTFSVGIHVPLFRAKT